MTYKEIESDLFDYYDDEYYVAQCISADYVCGAGIAVLFNRKLDMKHKLITNHLNESFSKDGIYIPTCIEIDRVFNLITKEFVWQKPTYLTLICTLMKMRDLILINNEHNTKTFKLALPLIGCGIDGLKWHVVRELIKDIFYNVNIDIVVCYLEQDKDKVFYGV